MSIKEQQKAGIPAERRGQETGLGNSPEREHQSIGDTPAVRGRLTQANKMAADKSNLQISSSSATQRTTTPSTPAMTTGGTPGKSPGEAKFKRRLAKQRQAGKKAVRQRS